MSQIGSDVIGGAQIGGHSEPETPIEVNDFERMVIEVARRNNSPYRKDNVAGWSPFTQGLTRKDSSNRELMIKQTFRNAGIDNWKSQAHAFGF